MTLLNLDQPIHQQIEELRDASGAKVPAEVRAYYDGDQPPVATPDQRSALGDRANNPYIENVLKQCVDTLASRLLFEGFVCEDGDTEQQWLQAFARKNQYGEHVFTNTVSVLVDGNNAMSLSWEVDESGSGRPIVHQEPWWDGKEGMFVEISDTGQSQWAVKEWTDLQKRKRRTVYLPDQIQRFVRVGESWSPYDSDDAGSWLTRWEKRDGSPLGVPVIHFGNTVNTRDFWGRSAVQPLLGLQDALNGTIFDIVASDTLNAFGIYTATGVTIDATDLSVGAGRLWKSENPDARFNVLNGSDMGPILDGYRAVRAAIANQFPISEHLITGGQWPSGTALQRAEGPMIGRVKQLGETFAPSHVTVAHRAMELANRFGNEDLNEDFLIQIEYKPAEQLDEGTLVEIDRERVAMFLELSRLPKTLMVRTGLVDEQEADAIIQEMERMQLPELSAIA